MYLQRFCDSAGIQTQDLQNRNLTLYSAKLRSLVAFLLAGAKVRIFFELAKFQIERFWQPTLQETIPRVFLPRQTCLDISLGRADSIP